MKKKASSDRECALAEATRRREAREEKLRALGYEDLTDEQRREFLARNLAGLSVEVRVKP